MIEREGMITSHEWAEVFRAGANADVGSQMSSALLAMEAKIKEIANRGRVKENMFMGKPISELTYEEALRARDHFLTLTWVPTDAWNQVNEIIAGGEW